MTTRGAAKRPATAGRIVVGARACDRQERHCRSRSESDEGRSPIGSRSFFGSPRRQIRSASARIGRDARFVSRGHRRPRAETITSLSVRVAMVHPSPDGDNSVTEHRGRHAAGARAHSYGTATGRRQVATLMRGVRCEIHALLRRALKDRAGVDGDIVPRFHAQPPPSFPRTPLDDLSDMIRLMVRHCTRSSPTGRVAGRAGMGWSSRGSPFARLVRPGWSATREAAEASSIGSRKARCESWRRCPAR